MVISSLCHRQLMIPWIFLSWEPGALVADSPLTSTRGCGCFFLFLKPSWTWLTATRITLWNWIFRLSLHARVTSWNLGLMTVVCFSRHSSSSQNKASSGETWHTQFPIDNRPYIIDNIVHTWSTFMMVNAHDGEQNIYIWTFLFMGRGNCCSIVCAGHIHVMMESALYTS